MCVGVKGRRNSKNQGVREEHADLNSQDDWGRDTQTETWWGRRLKKELWGSGYKTYRMQGETQSSFNRRAPKQNSLSWFLDCIQQRLNKKDFTIRLISPPPHVFFWGKVGMQREEWIMKKIKDWIIKCLNTNSYAKEEKLVWAQMAGFVSKLLRFLFLFSRKLLPNIRQE